MSRDTKRIRHLNDRLRQECTHGATGGNSVVVTDGIIAQGKPFVKAALKAVALHSAFTPDSDPWGEHDFGSIPLQGQTVLFKIDYFAKNMYFAAENPA
ncbi:MAG: DUF3768 domain-containing protein, partial [Paracoccaceae bacterium]